MLDTADIHGENLLFLAQTYSDIDEYEEALSCLRKYISEQNYYIESVLSMFGRLSKLIIDQYRKQLRSIEVIMSEERNPQRVESLQGYMRSKTLTLVSQCMDYIEFISAELLKKSDSKRTDVFCYKLKGDFYRYSAEFSKGEEREEYVDRAQIAYTSAINVASEHLKYSDPVRLGSLLNSAVFHFDFKKNSDLAIQLLQNAIHNSEGDIDELDEDMRNESKKLIEIMKENISAWVK